MEGVGARLGRTSTRHGPATVFTGPVRKWKKKWVHVAPPSNHNTSTHHSHQINGSSNGINGSHLLLYKWTPIAQSQNATISNGAVANGGDRDKVSAKDDGLLAASDEPPRRKFKYIPIALLEEQQNEAAEEVEDDGNSVDDEPVETQATPKNDGLDEKPDINDVPMEENQESNQVVCQDLNLSLGLNGHENDNDSGQKAEQTRNG
ncbi:hypothetical protein ACFX2J_005302 [Malus domestica]|uniref:uncharacterized protein n=1 Tax=Malus domestica TaxID=3750 RepID=UPI003975263B